MKQKEEKKEEEIREKKAGQGKKHNNKKTKIYHKETKCKMKINISNKNLKKNMNEDCKGSEKKH